MPTLEDIKDAREDNLGWCTHYREWSHDFCEPDAHEYTCPVCAKPTVYGAEELLMSLVH